MFKNFIDIIASPNLVFPRLQEKPTWFLPWLLIALLAVSVQFGFYNLVDPEYLLEQLVEQRMDSGIAASELRERMQGITDNTNILAVSSSVAVFVSLLVIYAVTAGYLHWVSKFSETESSFKQWFSLASWSGVPTVFSILAAWIVILSSAPLIDLQAMNPLNLNYLLFRSDGRFADLLNAFNLVAIWSVVLLVLGYKHFTSATYLKSAVVVLSPYVLILFIWTLFLL